MFRVLCETTNARLARFLFQLSHCPRESSGSVWLSSRANVLCAARDLGGPRDVSRSLRNHQRAFGPLPFPIEPLPAGEQWLSLVVIPSKRSLRSEGSRRAARCFAFFAKPPTRVWPASFPN